MWINGYRSPPAILFLRVCSAVILSTQMVGCTAGRTLPIFLESVILNMRSFCAYGYINYSHLCTALYERRCKITKKSLITRDVFHNLSFAGLLFDEFVLLDSSLF